MSTSFTAFLYTLVTGVVLWALSSITSSRGWLLSRRTDREKLDQQRIDTLQGENTRLRDLVQELREEILREKLETIGKEMTPAQQRLITYSLDEYRALTERAGPKEDGGTR